MALLQHYSCIDILLLGRQRRLVECSRAPPAATWPRPLAENQELVRKGQFSGRIDVVRILRVPDLYDVEQRVSKQRTSPPRTH